MWYDNIKKLLREISWSLVKWINFTQEKGQS